MEAQARDDQLHATLNEVLTAATKSEVSVLWGRLHTAFGEFHTIQETVVEGSQELATEVVEHVLVSLKTWLPNMPLEVALNGIVLGDEEIARE